ncbi:MAG TPA: pentapeptide repeat-containing protein [Verrucomicrobiae bacterium]|nr:pentapeptide repeat-containing protein [Verrucomicrobiae bacterium]
MKVAAPQLPAELTPLTDLKRQIMKDETISAVSVDQEDVTGVAAKSVSLSEVKATSTGFVEAKLERAAFIDCIFSKCDFTASKLPDASWQRTVLLAARASGVQLQNSTLKEITFDGCKLDLANFRFAKLKNVHFKDCDLTEADFYAAELHNVEFENCNLDRVEFSSSKLKKVDLRSSDILAIRGVDSLGGAIIDSSQLMALAPALAAHHKIVVED